MPIDFELRTFSEGYATDSYMRGIRMLSLDACVFDRLASPCTCWRKDSITRACRSALHIPVSHDRQQSFFLYLLHITLSSFPTRCGALQQKCFSPELPRATGARPNEVHFVYFFYFFIFGAGPDFIAGTNSNAHPGHEDDISVQHRRRV